VTVTAALRATTAQGTYGDAVRLIIRCLSGETDVFIQWYSYLGLDGPEITFRIGDNEARSVTWSGSTNNQSSFWPGSNLGSIGFVNEMLKVDRFTAQVTPYSENPITAVFELVGMDAATQRLREVCGW
jgi:type VI secretion system protein VasI